MSSKARLTLAAIPFLVLAGSCGMRDLARSMMYPGCPVAFGQVDCRGASVVRYSASDGVALEGAFVRTGKSDAPVALFFHGNGESAAQNLSFARELNEHGIDAFLAEYRGYGGLAGEPSEKGLYLDGLAALEQKIGRAH